jgi:hypothetical protein
MKALPSLFVLSLLVIRRHDAADHDCSCDELAEQDAER